MPWIPNCMREFGLVMPGLLQKYWWEQRMVSLRHGQSKGWHRHAHGTQRSSRTFVVHQKGQTQINLGAIFLQGLQFGQPTLVLFQTLGKAEQQKTSHVVCTSRRKISTNMGTQITVRGVEDYEQAGWRQDLTRRHVDDEWKQRFKGINIQDTSGHWKDIWCMWQTLVLRLG